MSTSEREWIDRCLAERMAGPALFSAGMAHELSNALLMIRGRAGHADDPAAATIQRACERVSDVAAALRLLGADEQQQVDLRTWWSAFRPLARCVLGGPIELVEAFEGSELRAAIGPGELTHAALGLVRNAAESLRQRRSGAVRVHALAEGDRVAIAVEDDGDGMTPEILARCREPGFTTRSAAGLGLTLAERAVTRAGGEMIVESAPGSGTRVVLILPAAHEPRVAAGTRVLVRLADARLRAMVLHELAAWGCVVTSEPSGDADFAVVDAQEPACAPVVFIGPAGSAPPDVIAVGARPRLTDLRSALIEAAQRRAR